MSSVISAEFDLVDHDGRRVEAASYLGSWQLIFFGFTNCRVVCPRALAKLSLALDLLGPQADAFTPLYITVDPDRDTPATMRSFLRSYPRFTGLTGTQDQTDAARRAFRVHAAKVALPGGGYDMPHTAFTHAISPQGQHVDHWPEALDTDEITTRLRRLLATTH